MSTKMNQNRNNVDKKRSECLKNVTDCGYSLTCCIYSYILLYANKIKKSFYACMYNVSANMHYALTYLHFCLLNLTIP